MKNDLLKRTWDKHSLESKYTYLTKEDVMKSKDFILNWVKDIKPCKVLDLGCGIGQYVAALNLLGFKTTGLDISPKSVNIAQEHGLNVILGDIRELPFEDNSFDIVITGGSLEHFPETEKGFSEVARVLKSKGLFLGNVPNRMTVFVVLKKIQQLVGVWKCGYEKSFTKKKLKTILNKHFKIIELKKSRWTIGKHKILSYIFRTIDDILQGGPHHFFYCEKK
jgi:ubiquinone/menaquinone biosynthesis C-methylase UbiE